MVSFQKYEEEKIIYIQNILDNKGKKHSIAVHKDENNLHFLGVFKKNSSKITFNLSLFAILITAIITINETFSVSRETLFNESVVIDSMSSLMKIITLIEVF